jgi:phenylacetate-CoA ligase
VKFALSRKNVWERLPRLVKVAVGTVLKVVPQQHLLGSGFRKHLSFVQQAERWSAEQARSYQLERLKSLCTLAYEKTAYYRRVFTEAGFDPRDLRAVEDLQRLPTIDRSTLQTSLNDMCTTNPQSSNIDYTSTGGTSGKPLAFYIGSNRSQIEYAYLVASWQRIGFQLGATLAAFRGRTVQQDDAGLYHEYDPLLRYHFYSNFHMTDENIERYLKHVSGLGPCFLHVYPSSVTALARFLRRSEMKPPQNIKGIIAESEIVYPEQRRFVEDIFGCRLFSSYGLTEKVIAAAECEHSSNYHVWPTYGFFELLDEEGKCISEPGKRGEIVGTGFINDIVPFIRYRTGDYATYVGDGCKECGREHLLISDIQGHRIQESLVASDGALISWTALNMHDDTFANVRQFQFYQDKPGCAVLRVLPAQGYGSSDKERIQARLQRKFDQRMSLEFEVVESIPLSRSGKAIYVDQRIPGIHAETETPTP